MAATAPMDVEIRFLHSAEQVGQVCAQLFLVELDPGQGIGHSGQYRRFQQLQFSSWHPSVAAASGDLEAKMKLEGFKTAVME